MQLKKLFALAALALLSPGVLHASTAADNDSVPTVPGINDGTQGPVVILSREQCIELALQDNLSVRVADMEVKRADYSKKETLSALFPKIDFSGAYQRSIRLQTIKMNMGGQSTSIQMGTDNTWNFGFTASMPLINAQLWKSIDISDTQILANLETARASRLNLVDQVNKAYYALLLAKASYDVVRENYNVAVLNASIYEKKFSVGVASEFDVLRSSVQIKNIEPQLLQAEIAIKQCKLQLKLLMNVDASVDIEPNVTLEQMQRDMYSYNVGNDRCMANNSSVRSLDIQTRLLEQNLDIKKRAFLPSLAATFNINWSALSNGSPFKHQEFNPYSSVGLALSVPIFSGGSRYYGVQGAKVQLAEVSLQRENLINSLNMQVDLAIDNINKEVAQIQTSKEGVKQAEKAHEIMQKSFDIGAASYLDLRDAELAETSAKLAYYQAIYNYLVSTSDLDNLLGRDYYSPNNR